MIRRLAILFCLVVASDASAANPPCASASMRELLGEIDGLRMKRNVESLAAFGTRHTLSDTTSATRGVGAARNWILAQMQEGVAASGGRMTVAFQSSMQQSQRTGDKPVEVTNVVATIRGTTDPNRVYVVTGHYDSRNTDIMDAAGDAPGADDDASGTAVVMELARVLSRRPMDATVVLAAVAGEEQGLLGSKGLAEAAIDGKWDVEGMITNDIVGGVEGGNGALDNRTVRIFSTNEKGSGESPSRHFARFVRDSARQDLPGVNAKLIYRLDRYGRGGDHISFFEKGFPAIRFTEANEIYSRQHQNVRLENGIRYGDLPEYVSADYLRTVASLNASAIVRASCAPAAPAGVAVKGAVTADTTLTWTASPEEDIAGYEILIRDTSADEWEKVIQAGKVNTFTLSNIAIDNYFFGVRAVDRDGNRSPVRTPPER